MRRDGGGGPFIGDIDVAGSRRREFYVDPAIFKTQRRLTG
jgi:hypothetical protein